jgi:Flp pilus assembly protein TadD
VVAVDQLADEPALQAYHLLPSVRGELLIRLGRLDEARTELERAALLTRNEQDRRMLLTRAATLGQLGHRRSELVSSLLADLLDAASRNLDNPWTPRELA